MSQALPKRKPAPRLHSFDYKGQFVYSITICVYNKASIFTEEKIINPILEILYSECKKAYFDILAYCFMPDHLHLLLAGEEKSNLAEMMKRFKQASSFEFKLGERAFPSSICNLKFTF